MTKKVFMLQGTVWLYPGESANWHFVALPKRESEEIKKTFGVNSPGWGSLPVEAKIGETSWKTSIFPDKRSQGYLLPLKAAVRYKENIHDGDKISFVITVVPKGK